MAFGVSNKNQNKLRVIKTARDIKSINNAALKGFKPLLRKVQQSDEIISKYSVIQNTNTGEIEVLGDYRSRSYIDKKGEFETVIDWTFYYPYRFKSQFAAYLIPKDITVGEKVFIKDLIEDYIGSYWNQGDTFRLDSCEAIWNGTDLEIQYNPNINRDQLIG